MDEERRKDEEVGRADEELVGADELDDEEDLARGYETTWMISDSNIGRDRIPELDDRASLL